MRRASGPSLSIHAREPAVRPWPVAQASSPSKEANTIVRVRVGSCAITRASSIRIPTPPAVVVGAGGLGRGVVVSAHDHHLLARTAQGRDDVGAPDPVPLEALRIDLRQARLAELGRHVLGRGHVARRAPRMGPEGGQRRGVLQGGLAVDRGGEDEAEQETHRGAIIAVGACARLPRIPKEALFSCVELSCGPSRCLSRWARRLPSPPAPCAGAWRCWSGRARRRETSPRSWSGSRDRRSPPSPRRRPSGWRRSSSSRIWSSCRWAGA